MDEPQWRVSEPPIDRHFLALAIAAGTLNEAAMIVAAWNETVNEWQPVKVPGDVITRSSANHGQSRFALRMGAKR